MYRSSGLGADYVCATKGSDGLPNCGAPFGPVDQFGSCGLMNMAVFGRCIPVPIVYGMAALVALFAFGGGGRGR